MGRGRHGSPLLFDNRLRRYHLFPGCFLMPWAGCRRGCGEPTGPWCPAERCDAMRKRCDAMRSRAVGMIAVIGAWSLLTGSDARRLRAEERQGDLVRVSSPAPDAMVKGLLDFAVQIAGLPGIASVEYRLNDRDLSGPLSRWPEVIAHSPC